MKSQMFIVVGLFSCFSVLGACSKASSPTKSEDEAVETEEQKTDEAKPEESVSVSVGGEGGGTLLLADAPTFFSGSSLVGSSFAAGAEHKISFSSPAVEGVVNECSVTLRGVALANSATWADCTAGFVPKNSDGSALADGHYDLHARAKFSVNGAPSSAVVKSFYVNSSLNNAEKCADLTAEEKEALFKFGKSYLQPEKFAENSDFQPPKVQIGFVDGSVFPVDTLRRKFDVNDDKSMAIMSRSYVSRKHGDCKAIRFRTLGSHRNAHATHAIYSGSGACVYVNLDSKTLEVTYRGAFSKQYCFAGRNASSRFSPKFLVGTKLDSHTVKSGENVNIGIVGFED